MPLTGFLYFIASIVAGYIDSFPLSKDPSINDIRDVLDVLSVSELREISKLELCKVCFTDLELFFMMVFVFSFKVDL